MDTNLMPIAAISSKAEVDHAIATLVLAFSTDPVARWMYELPHHYLRHGPRLFQALGASCFKAGAAQRTRDGLCVALWLPPGLHADDTEVETVIAGSVDVARQAEVSAVFEQTEHFRPTEPHWYLSLIGVEVLHRNKGYGSALLQHGLRECDSVHLAAYLWSSNPQNIPLYKRHGFETVGIIQVGSSPPIFPMRRSAR
jgi:ribosomal protein S18 acetylase RimI-like enzyme